MGPRVRYGKFTLVRTVEPSDFEPSDLFPRLVHALGAPFQLLRIEVHVA
jgi:hypothetical protein